jgi:hypothetical protein
MFEKQAQIVGTGGVMESPKTISPSEKGGIDGSPQKVYDTPKELAYHGDR